MTLRLSQMAIKEVSFVGAPANRKKFLIIKEEKCSDCGGILKQMRIGEEDSCTQLKCSGCGKLNKRLLRKEGYKMEKLIEIFKQFMGDDFEEFTKEETVLLEALTEESQTVLVDSITLLEKYKSDMPEDLKGAVGTLIKQATGKAPYPYTVPEKDNEAVLNKFLEKYKKDIEELEKAGKKLSKDTIETIKAVIKSLTDIPSVIETLQSLLPDGTPPVKKDKKDIDKNDEGLKVIQQEMTDAIGAITTSVEKMVEDNKTAMEELKKSSEEAGKRLETLEKEKGIKKSIDDDGAADDDDKTINKDKGPNWSSITDAMSE